MKIDLINKINEANNFTLTNKPVEAKKAIDHIIMFINKYITAARNASLNERDLATLSQILCRLNTEKALSKDVLSLHDRMSKLALKAILIQQKKTEISEEDLSLAAFSYKRILDSVLKDASEEVVGQERQPQTIVKLISNSKKLSSLNTETLTKIAAEVYPIAVLSATMSSQAKIPTREKENEALKKDKDQFIREYKSQFGQQIGPSWTADFFAKCLQQAWEQKRDQARSSEIPKTLSGRPRQWKKRES